MVVKRFQGCLFMGLGPVGRLVPAFFSPPPPFYKLWLCLTSRGRIEPGTT